MEKPRRVRKGLLIALGYSALVEAPLEKEIVNGFVTNHNEARMKPIDFEPGKVKGIYDFMTENASITVWSTSEDIREIYDAANGRYFSGTLVFADCAFHMYSCKFENYSDIIKSDWTERTDFSAYAEVAQQNRGLLMGTEMGIL